MGGDVRPQPDGDPENLGPPVAREQGEWGDALDIYELDGDTLKVCCVVGTWKGKEWTGKAQLKEFKLGGAEVLIDLRRVKPDGK